MALTEYGKNICLEFFNIIEQIHKANFTDEEINNLSHGLFNDDISEMELRKIITQRVNEQELSLYSNDN